MRRGEQVRCILHLGEGDRMAGETKFRQKREFLIQREKRECVLEVLPVAHVSSDTNRTLSAVGARSGDLAERKVRVVALYPE